MMATRIKGYIFLFSAHDTTFRFQRFLVSLPLPPLHLSPPFPQQCEYCPPPPPPLPLLPEIDPMQTASSYFVLLSCSGRTPTPPAQTAALHAKVKELDRARSASEDLILSLSAEKTRMLSTSGEASETIDDLVDEYSRLVSVSNVSGWPFDPPSPPPARSEVER